MITARWPVLLLLLLLPVSIASQSPPRAADTPGAAIQLVDVTAKSNISFVHQSGASTDKRMVETFGSGVAWIDYDNNGFVDLYFVNGAPGAANALYRNNKGDGSFTDVTATAGVAADGSRSFKTGVARSDKGILRSIGSNWPITATPSRTGIGCACRRAR